METLPVAGGQFPVGRQSAVHGCQRPTVRCQSLLETDYWKLATGNRRLV